MMQLGVDANLHSGTKYMGGHSDLLLGLVTTSPWTERGRALGTRLKQVQYAAGAVASPFDSWLTLRGLRTLHVRVERACQTALALATFLSTHPSVHIVHYPGLEAHPQHDIAVRQMKNGGFGGVLSFELPTEAQAMAVVGAEHRASIEPPGRVTSPPGLLRVSVGLEDASDLIQDFARALAIAEEVTK
jgi:cystathionine gamma-synthase